MNYSHLQFVSVPSGSFVQFSHGLYNRNSKFHSTYQSVPSLLYMQHQLPQTIASSSPGTPSPRPRFRRQTSRRLLPNRSSLPNQSQHNRSQSPRKSRSKSTTSNTLIPRINALSISSNNSTTTTNSNSTKLPSRGRRCSRCGQSGHNSRSCQQIYFQTNSFDKHRARIESRSCVRCKGAGVVACGVCNGCDKLFTTVLKGTIGLPAPPTFEIMSLSHLSYVYRGEGRSEICFRCAGSSLVVCPDCRGLA
uniref:CCHC-type domain-containing protein n=1 Tax=Timspurckia oligopyrenoides TaxID=708627 RepID=A0A7S0ZL53_9RHOD|mmetsp:Transcript_9569/g.17234  ORF Transcript_9569/g.17234 Transcript_9569/m.17234 type:complete len:249 (+) Transcript_9569:490-1236(+)